MKNSKHRETSLKFSKLSRTKFSPRSRGDLSEILGTILTAEIFGPRQDLAETPLSRRPKSGLDLDEVPESLWISKEPFVLHRYSENDQGLEKEPCQ